MTKKIPIGTDNFKKIISENYLYIDKSRFIEDLINDGAEVKLFTRPRRFGKSLNMSMLKYFFDIQDSDNNASLFNNLYIKQSPVFEHQGKYPVISITMKEIQPSDMQNCIEAVRLLLESVFKEFRYIINGLDEFDKITYLKYATEKLSVEEIKKGIRILSDILFNYYKRPVIILIDEYDAPLTYAYAHGYYKEAIEFFKTVYTNALKSNPNLKMGVLTGAIRVAQAGIFSDLNNLKVNTVLNRAYDEYFGLTQSEVDYALNEFSLTYDTEIIKEWYDGYLFGNSHIYNPWSILNYIDSQELKPHWVNTSGNLLIKELLIRSDSHIFRELEQLVDDNITSIFINESISLGNQLEPNSLWEFMLFSGYLTVAEKINDHEYKIKIPNKEIRTFFKTLYSEIIFHESNNITTIKEALKNKNISAIVRILEKVVINALSFYDTNIKYENPYQTLLAGFLYALDGFYNLSSNIETGYGRADIILKPEIKGMPGYILELKRAKTKDLAKEAQKALKQIEKNRYDSYLLKEGVTDIVKIGMVFDSKKAMAYHVY